MATRHTTFSEVMEGPCRVQGDPAGPCRLELDVDLAEPLSPRTDAEAVMSGRVRLTGLADDPHATGTMHIAPIARRRIRYRLDFTALDGRRLHLDGWKSIGFLRPVHSMTTLPVTVTDDDGTVVAEARLRFHLASDLWPMVRSFRFPRPAQAAQGDLRPRWNGERGKLEVWYTTLTDPESGTGVWLHHELVAPVDGGPPRLHGWAAVFPADDVPHVERFGPYDWKAPQPEKILTAPDLELTERTLTGRAGKIEWDLRVGAPPGRTLFTFPRWAWRGLLPAAQIVPQPGARYDGSVRYADRTLELTGAPGATAHIYGRGNAERWAWLHADLGDGDVAEVVAAVSTLPGLRRLPPLPFVRLRVDGRDLPASDTLRNALRLRARIGLPEWQVHGRVGDYRLHITVTQPPDRTVAVDYRDPDGAPAVCRNSERADAHIVLEHRENGEWRPYREWRLAGTAHAEVGDRA